MIEPKVVGVWPDQGLTLTASEGEREMKYKVMSQERNKDYPKKIIIARFENQGMAMWAATIFTAHKIFGRDNIYWVEKGKKSFVPCTAINPEHFNLYIPDKS